MLTFLIVLMMLGLGIALAVHYGYWDQWMTYAKNVMDGKLHSTSAPTTAPTSAATAAATTAATTAATPAPTPVAETPAPTPAAPGEERFGGGGDEGEAKMEYDEKYDETYDEILGCMDPSATNFVKIATEDDGSCEYPPPAPTPVAETPAPKQAAPKPERVEPKRAAPKRAAPKRKSTQEQIKKIESALASIKMDIVDEQPTENFYGGPIHYTKEEFGDASNLDGVCNSGSFGRCGAW